jgi:hypothetical protein
MMLLNIVKCCSDCSGDQQQIVTRNLRLRPRLIWVGSMKYSPT